MQMGSVDYLHKDTIRRIAKDVSNIYKSPLDKEGIYYVHNDDNMLKGYAMIIGPKDTLYTNGMYLFEFSFPKNYPYRPPKVIMKTNNGLYRMHPNLYRKTADFRSGPSSDPGPVSGCRRHLGHGRSYSLVFKCLPKIADVAAGYRRDHRHQVHRRQCRPSAPRCRCAVGLGTA